MQAAGSSASSSRWNAAAVRLGSPAAAFSACRADLPTVRLAAATVRAM